MFYANGVSYRNTVQNPCNCAALPVRRLDNYKDSSLRSTTRWHIFKCPVPPNSIDNVLSIRAAGSRSSGERRQTLARACILNVSKDSRVKGLGPSVCHYDK